MALKMAVLAPMPSASDSTTTVVHPLDCQQQADGVAQVFQHSSSGRRTTLSGERG